MIFSYFKEFFYFFKDYRRAFIKYSILSLIAAIMELSGVALIYPFMLKLLSNNSDKKLIFTIGFAIVCLFLSKNVFMIFYTYVQANFTNRFELAIKKRIINFFLNTDFLQTSKFSLAYKGKVLNILIPNIMNNFILRLLNLNINLCIFIFISLFVAIKFPLATFISVIGAILLIKLQNSIYKPLLIKISKKVSETALASGQAYNEALLNIKSIKISNKEKYFYDKFNSSLSKHYNNTKQISFFNLIPPYIIEPFAIILLFILLFIITWQNINSPQDLIASFALVAAAIFRLTPAISRIQVNLNGINSALPMVQEFIDFYKEYKISKVQEIKKAEFCEFSFGYEKDNLILNNINLSIKKGELIGIAGLSGAGKTTLADIIAGLYRPNSGEILVDGEIQKLPLKIGYIPQEFSLISGSIKDNVVFGCNDINDDKVIDALRKAQLYDFIAENYPEGINAKPFTDSVGFSQGQKQRLAIARALYSNPDILILDEATSSLDLETEDEICHVLKELKGEKTIIVIAHRLSTIKEADRIIFMENREIADTGSFNELTNKSERFRKLVELSSYNK